MQPAAMRAVVFHHEDRRKTASCPTGSSGDQHRAKTSNTCYHFITSHDAHGLLHLPRRRAGHLLRLCRHLRAAIFLIDENFCPQMPRNLFADTSRTANRFVSTPNESTSCAHTASTQGARGVHVRERRERLECSPYARNSWTRSGSKQSGWRA